MCKTDVCTKAGPGRAGIVHQKLDLAISLMLWSNTLGKAAESVRGLLGVRAEIERRCGWC